MSGLIVLFGAGVIAIIYLLFFKGAIKAGAASTGSVSLTIDQMIAQASAKWGVQIALIKAIIKKESGFNPKAQNPEGTPSDLSDDSYGLMQVSLRVAQDFGLVEDWRNATGYEISMLLDPQININIGTWFLGRLLLKYPLIVAVQMYNVGEQGYNSGYRAPQYLEDVMRYYDDYKRI